MFKNLFQRMKRCIDFDVNYLINKAVLRNKNEAKRMFRSKSLIKINTPETKLIFDRQN